MLHALMQIIVSTLAKNKNKKSCEESGIREMENDYQLSYLPL
jgi:hypothetical protein